MSRKRTKTKTPTTKLMVLEALRTLHSRRGVSLTKLKQHIFLEYNIQNPKLRSRLINKSLHEYLAAGVVKNLSKHGRGLTGSLRLLNVNAIETIVNNVKILQEIEKHTQDMEESNKTPEAPRKKHMSSPMHNLSPTKRRQVKTSETPCETPRTSLSVRRKKRRLLDTKVG